MDIIQPIEPVHEFNLQEEAIGRCLDRLESGLLRVQRLRRKEILRTSNERSEFGLELGAIRTMADEALKFLVLS